MTGPARSRWIARVLGGLGGIGKPAKHPDGPAAQQPAPLTRTRISDYLEVRGYRYLLDDDGDLTGTWDGSRFWFLLLGEHEEILQVRGRWQRTVPLERRGGVALAVNDWNRDRIWPKVYAREEDGVLALYSEVSADLEEGATDDQLAQLIACGLGTGVQLFTAFDEILPLDEKPPPGLPNN